MPYSLPKRTRRPALGGLEVDVFQEAEMLRKVPFFGGLDPAKLKLLAFTSRAVKFGPGELLMSRGAPSVRDRFGGTMARWRILDIRSGRQLRLRCP